MKGKKKKKMYYYMRGWGFAAVVFVILICASVSGGFYTDPPIIDPGGPYEAWVDEYVPFKFMVLGGIPPFDWYIILGDGTNRTILGVNDSYVEFAHKYSEAGRYIVIINVVDNNGYNDTAIAYVIIKDHPDKPKLNVIVETDYCWRADQMATRVILHIIIVNYGKEKCEEYNISIIITDDRTGKEEYNIINPGEPICPGCRIDDDLGFPLKVGIYTSNASLSSGSGDRKIVIDYDVCTFLVLPEKLCEFMEDLPERLRDFFEDYILPILIPIYDRIYP